MKVADLGVSKENIIKIITDRYTEKKYEYPKPFSLCSREKVHKRLQILLQQNAHGGL